MLPSFIAVTALGKVSSYWAVSVCLHSALSTCISENITNENSQHLKESWHIICASRGYQANDYPSPLFL
jgi:hypothetical protein